MYEKRAKFDRLDNFSIIVFFLSKRVLPSVANFLLSSLLCQLRVGLRACNALGTLIRQQTSPESYQRIIFYFHALLSDGFLAPYAIFIIHTWVERKTFTHISPRKRPGTCMILLLCLLLFTRLDLFSSSILFKGLINCDIFYFTIHNTLLIQTTIKRRIYAKARATKPVP